MFITCTHQGEVQTHEGYLSQSEAKRKQRGEEGEAVKADAQRPGGSCLTTRRIRKRLQPVNAFWLTLEYSRPIL